MRSADADGAELLETLRWRQEWAAAVMEDAKERVKIAAEMQQIVG